MINFHNFQHSSLPTSNKNNWARKLHVALLSFHTILIKVTPYPAQNLKRNDPNG